MTLFPSNLIQSLTYKNEAHKESILREAITKHLGDSWNIEELRGRLELVSFPENDCYYLDKEFLMMFVKEWEFDPEDILP